MKCNFQQCNGFICGLNWFLSRSKELQSETVDLRERIKHLNDMVFCQQRKVKGMIEEVRRFNLSVCVNAVHSCMQVFCSTCVLIMGVDDIDTLAKVAKVCLTFRV